MQIRELLIDDIQKAPPALLNAFYEVWKVLRTNIKFQEQERKTAAAATLIGSTSEEDADEIMNIINQEFNQIEGDW